MMVMLQGADWRGDGTDFEDINVKMGCDLIADTYGVTDQVKERPNLRVIEEKTVSGNRTEANNHCICGTDTNYPLHNPTLKEMVPPHSVVAEYIQWHVHSQGNQFYKKLPGHPARINSIHTQSIINFKFL